MAIDRAVPSQAPFAFRVKVIEMVSEDNPKITYDVTLPSCSCPDFRYRQRDGKVCKHLDAAIGSGLGAWIDPQLAEVGSKLAEAAS